MPTESTPLARGGARALVWLAPVLGFPWFLHAGVVLLSALGAPALSRSLALVLVAGAFAFALWLARGVAASAGPDAGEVAPTGTQHVLAHAGGLGLLARGLGVSGLVAFALALGAAFALPVVAYDAIGYRLPVIAQWLDARRIAWVVTDDAVRNGYPLGQEAISAVFAAISGRIRTPAAVSGLHVLAGGLSVQWLLERCGVERRLALAALGAFLLVPMTLLNMPSGYVDAAFAGASVALICAAAAFDASLPDAAADAPTDKHRFLARAVLGMSAAQVLALKGTGLPFVVFALAVLLGNELVLRRTAPGQLVRALAPALFFALPGTFWAIRNVVQTGNPLWPVAVQIAGRTWLAGTGTMEQVLDTIHNTPPELAPLGSAARVFSTWLQLHGPAGDFDDRLGGLGYAWPLFALPALLTFVVLQARARSREARWAPIMVALVLTALCFALQPMKWWSRYTLWVWGAGMLAIFALADRLVRAGKSRALLAPAVAFVLVLTAEGAYALSHVQNAALALARWQESSAALDDPRQAKNALEWIAPKFWTLGLDHAAHVCRGSWKPGSDDANLDGVLAQLDPRPRVHVVFDDDALAWPRVRGEFQQFGCSELLLLRGSPVLASARQDPQFSVEEIPAFDPLFVVRKQ